MYARDDVSKQFSEIPCSSKYSEQIEKRNLSMQNDWDLTAIFETSSKASGDERDDDFPTVACE